MTKDNKQNIYIYTAEYAYSVDSQEKQNLIYLCIWM